jgi:nucleotide-binding universal stress UspA family protein
MFEHIVMAIDGSEPAKKAIPVAIDLATKSHGEVTVVHVHQKELTSRECNDVETLEEARMLTRAAMDLVQKGGVKATAELRPARFDEVAHEILAVAEEHHADTIVIGSTGHGLVSEFLLGSVAHQVLKQAHCPVVVAH